MGKYSDSKVQPIHPIVGVDISGRYYVKPLYPLKREVPVEAGLFERILQREIELLRESEVPQSNSVLDEIGKSFDTKYQEYQLRKIGDYSKD